MVLSSVPSSRRRRRWPYLLPIAAMVVLVAVFGERLVNADRSDGPHLLPSVLLNTPMPKFTLTALPGRKTSTTTPFTDADLKGHVSLINVFGSWCIACLEEHPVLMAIAKQGQVPIYGIDWRDTPERGAEWLSDHGDPYGLIGQDPDSATAIDLGVTGAPESYVVDADGIIRYKVVGEDHAPEIWRSTLQTAHRRSAKDGVAKNADTKCGRAKVMPTTVDVSSDSSPSPCPSPRWGEGTPLHLLAPLPHGERSRGVSRAGEGAVQRSIFDAVGMSRVFLHLLLLCALVFGTAMHARAVEPSEMMADPRLEARARVVSQALRCVVCRNESIDDSNAELAHDMRMLVRRRIAAGDTNAQVLQYMVGRYGDFVLLNPRFMTSTVLLWLGPLIILILGGVGLIRVVNRARPAAAPLSPQEKLALAKLTVPDRDSKGASL